MVAPGASVSTGQSVMELETDKAVVEVPSSVSGTVQEIRVKEGDKIKVGQVIFTVDGTEGKASLQPSGGSAAPAAVEQKAMQQEEVQPKHAEGESSPAPVAVKPSAASATGTRSSAPSAPPPLASYGASEFKLPELGENISQGDLVRLM